MSTTIKFRPTSRNLSVKCATPTNGISTGLKPTLKRLPPCISLPQQKTVRCAVRKGASYNSLGIHTSVLMSGGLSASMCCVPILQTVRPGLQSDPSAEMIIMNTVMIKERGGQCRSWTHHARTSGVETVVMRAIKLPQQCFLTNCIQRRLGTSHDNKNNRRMVKA